MAFFDLEHCFHFLVDSKIWAVLLLCFMTIGMLNGHSFDMRAAFDELRYS